MRVKAPRWAVGYRNEQVRLGWTGMATIEVESAVVDQIFQSGSVTIPQAAELVVNSGVVLRSPSSAALGRRMPDGRIKAIRTDLEAFGVHGRSAEQRVALDLLLDPSVGIVSLGGRAGTGKSAMALCAGLELVMERHQFAKVMVFRPLFAVGGQDSVPPGQRGREDDSVGTGGARHPQLGDQQIRHR